MTNGSNVNGQQLAGLRDERAVSLLARLARRAAEWGWREVYERIRSGENVGPFYEAMVKLTRERRAGKKPPAPTDERLWEEGNE